MRAMRQKKTSEMPKTWCSGGSSLSGTVIVTFGGHSTGACQPPPQHERKCSCRVSCVVCRVASCACRADVREYGNWEAAGSGRLRRGNTPRGCSAAAPACDTPHDPVSVSVARACVCGGACAVPVNVWIDFGELLDLFGERGHRVREDQPRHPLVAVRYRQRPTIVLHPATSATPLTPHSPDGGREWAAYVVGCVAWYHAHHVDAADRTVRVGGLDLRRAVSPRCARGEWRRYGRTSWMGYSYSARNSE